MEKMDASTISAKETQRSYLELHLAVFLWGFTAILGKLITLEEIALVWWRVLITCLSLLLFKVVWKNLPKIPRKTILKMMGVGVVVATHWVLFFGSIKYSNVSICLVCMATGSFFAAILEPIIMKYKHRWYELALGFFVIPGMFLVVKFIPVDKLMGVYMGLASAFLAALFAILNKTIIDKEPKTNPLAMTFVELGSGWLFLSIVFPIFKRYVSDTPFQPQGINDLIYLLILALLCTTFAYVLGLRALRHLSAFTSTLVVNLEPVYGIVLAWLFFNENEEVGEFFYLGVFIILLAVFIHPLLVKYFEKKPIEK